MAADKEIGVRLTADDQVSPKVKEIKQQLKEAQADVVKLTDKFGATSKQAADAAKRAAELKDKIQDAAQLVDAFNPDTKFKAFGASIQTVVGGFTALTGVMGLLGVESEEVQKTLLKVQSALALSQGIAQLQEGMQAFKNLGTVISNSLGKSGMIGIAIAGVAALGAALLGAFDGPSVKIKELNNSLKDLVKGAAEAGKEVNLMKNAFRQAELGIITKDEALKKYNEGIGKTIGFAKDLNEAEKLTTENAAAYIKVQGLKAQANYILGKSSELEAKARINQAGLDKADEATFFLRKELFQQRIDQQKKDAEDLKLLITGINNEIAAASVNFKTISPTTTGPKGETKDIVDYREKKRALQQIDQEATDFEISQAALKIERERALQTEIGNIEQAGLDAHDNRLNTQAQMEALQTQTRIKLAEEEQKAKEEIAQATADTLGAIADLIGRDTAAGKVLAVAQATINTYLGASKAIAQGGIFGTIAAIGVIAAGLAQVKNIIAVKLPPKYDKGGGSISSSVSAPLTVQRPGNQTTTLDQQSLNALGNSAIRAYVTETDMSTNQERVRRLNRSARIG